MRSSPPEPTGQEALAQIRTTPSGPSGPLKVGRLPACSWRDEIIARSRARTGLPSAPSWRPGLGSSVSRLGWKELRFAGRAVQGFREAGSMACPTISCGSVAIPAPARIASTSDNSDRFAPLGCGDRGSNAARTAPISGSGNARAAAAGPGRNAEGIRSSGKRSEGVIARAGIGHRPTAGRFRSIGGAALRRIV